jgi:hypothetical protein
MWIYGSWLSPLVLVAKLRDISFGLFYEANQLPAQGCAAGAVGFISVSLAQASEHEAAFLPVRFDFR